MTVKKGRATAAIAPSGSGKTTLLPCVNFLERAGSGMMAFGQDDFSLCQISKKGIARLRKKTAFASQNHSLFPNKTSAPIRKGKERTAPAETGEDFAGDGAMV